MVEHAAVNRGVEGSSPSSGAIFQALNKQRTPFHDKSNCLSVSLRPALACTPCKPNYKIPVQAVMDTYRSDYKSSLLTPKFFGKPQRSVPNMNTSIRQSCPGGYQPLPAGLQDCLDRLR